MVALAVLISPALACSTISLPWVWLPLKLTVVPFAVSRPAATALPLTVSSPRLFSAKSPAAALLPSLLIPAPSAPSASLRMAAAFSVVCLPAVTEPLLLSRPADWTSVLTAAYILPLLATPPCEASRRFSAALRVPRLVMLPSALTTTSPADAPIFPALCTPTPFSVPSRRILLAYMPPRAATSMATTGDTLPSAAFAVTSLCCAPTRLRPAVTFRSLAQIPALTLTARAIRSVLSCRPLSSPAPFTTI